MKKHILLTGICFTVQLFQFLCSGQTSCSSSGSYRLYSSSSSTPESEGTVQYCYSGTWYSVCDYGWNCAEGNVICRQLGFGEARSVVTNSDNYFGSWSYIRNYYYQCHGSESGLDYCSYYSVSSSYCRSSSDQAGVRCTGNLGQCTTGDVQLVGGNNDSEGALEYCYSGSWSPICSLDDEEATVACRQLGYYHYTWASVLEGTFSPNTNYVTVTASCSGSAVEHQLSSCIHLSTSSSCATTCSQTVGIRCYDPGECVPGAVRLLDGVLEQEGRVEVCVSGVWGSICGSSWSTIDGYVICKQLGFDDAKPTVYSDSEYGDGYGPIVYSHVSCNGWEKGIDECSKLVYLQFTCSRTSVSGVLCHDDCTNGDVRLTGGDYDWEGTVEVCFNRLWGTIADSGWDNNDAAVICRQLGYSTNGVLAVSGSFYDKPNKTVHFEQTACSGNEQTISQCSRSSYSLEEGKAAISSVEVAGVQCQSYTPTITSTMTCASLKTTQSLVPQCTENGLRLVGGNSSNEGRLEFCYQQQWSPFCNLQHVEASVACKQLGYTQYNWAAIITSGEFGSSQNYSLFDNITCSSAALEHSLGSCTVNVGPCLTMCTNNIGIRCFDYGTCNEGESRIVDGFVEQEGRVEVCVSGVWGSVCSTGWDTNDANVVCRKLGFLGSKAIPYYDFGTGDGPIVYSNMDCDGWENSLSECSSESYLMFDCPSFEVAGVFCADYCFAGEVQLVGGASEVEGTVEVCLDSLWGLIDESGWGLNDAHVVCEQLGYGTDNAQPVFGSFYGKPNKTIHASRVFCQGDEEELVECSMTLHSLDDGREQLDKVNVAGVSCIQPEDVSLMPNSSLTTLVSESSTVICQPFPSPTTVMVVDEPGSTGVDCNIISTNHVPATMYTTVYIPTTTTVYSTTTSVTKATTTEISVVTVTNTLSLVGTVTSVSTASTTIYSTLTSISVSTATATLISTDTTTQVSTSTVTSVSTSPFPTTVFETTTVTSTAPFTQCLSAMSKEISTATVTKTSITTYTDTSISTITMNTTARVTTETSTATVTEGSITTIKETTTATVTLILTPTPKSISTTTVYISGSGAVPSMRLSCNNTSLMRSGNQNINNANEPATEGKETVTKISSSVDLEEATSENNGSNENFSILLIVVSLTFMLIAVVVVIGVVVVVIMVRKHSKRQLIYTHQSPVPVDGLTTSPPTYYPSQENAYEMEKEEIKEAIKKGEDAQHEDDNLLETSQDKSSSETGM